MTEFRDKPEYKRGQTGSRIVADRLKALGWYVIPSEDYSGQEDNKAPSLVGFADRYVTPDLDVSKAGTRKWVEVKTKKQPSPGRVLKGPCHGFRLRHLENYRRVQAITGAQVFLAVYEECSGDVLIRKLDDLPKPFVTTMRKNGRDDGPHAFFRRDAFRFFFNVHSAAAPSPEAA